jgi:uncharacterized membrane protein required for colicin V production
MTFNMNLSYLDLGIIATLILCGLLGFLRGFILALLGLLVFSITAFIALTVVDAFLPGIINSEPIRNSLTSANINVSADNNYVKVAVYTVALGLGSPIIGMFTRGFGANLPVTISGRFLGAFVGIVHCIAILVSFYVIAGLLLPPIRWANSLKAGHSLKVIYEIGKTCSDFVLPEQMRPNIKSPFEQFDAPRE